MAPLQYNRGGVFWIEFGKPYMNLVSFVALSYTKITRRGLTRRRLLMKKAILTGGIKIAL